MNNLILFFQISQVPENRKKAEKELKNGRKLELIPHPIVIRSYGTISQGLGFSLSWVPN